MSTFSIPRLPDTLSRELIANERMARALMNERFRSALSFFSQEATTVTALAAHFGISVANAYYYVKVLTQLKLLEVKRSQKRAGKALNYYCCSADSYFIPSQVAPMELKAFLKAAEEPWNSLLEQSIEKHVYMRKGWGLRFFRDDVGNIHTAITPEKNWQDWHWLEHDFQPEHAAIFSATVPLQLNPDQSKALQKELAELFQKYYIDTLSDNRNVTTKPSHVMRIELAPVL